MKPKATALRWVNNSSQEMKRLEQKAGPHFQIANSPPAFPSKLVCHEPTTPSMTTPAPDRTALTPLPYHHVIVDFLRRYEPEVWAWASARPTGAEQQVALRAALLRDTYRIERDAHA